MKLEEIKGIIKLVAEAQLHFVELEQAGIKIKLVGSTQPQGLAQQPAETRQPAAVEAQLSQSADDRGVDTLLSTQVQEEIITVKSTMIGTYCAAPAKDKPPFVRPGKQIAAGEAICSIKALNLFNEVEALVSGTIEEVLVKDGEAVEYDQPLFLVKVKN